MSEIQTALPKVAIVGRPNVGKSTLFNILTDSRKAVVRDQAGVTRDLIFEPAEIWGKGYELVDTGGLTESRDIFSVLIREHVIGFLGSVDFIIAVMDGRAGLVPEDRDVIRLIKETGRPFLIAVNKVDSHWDEDVLRSEFYEFGEEPVACSFEQRRGVAQILEWLHQRLPENPKSHAEGLRIALVGKPNVGKSSLCNRILGEPRMLVSEVAGTTIDSVDTPFRWQEQDFVLVDTAGLRRASRREEDLEIISAYKSEEAIRRADIVLLVIDGTQGPTEQDAKILEAIVDDHKGVVVVANKSDLGRTEVENYRETFREQIEKNFHFFPDVPLVFSSAKTGSGLEGIMEEVSRVASKLSFRVSTQDLNDFFFDTIRKAPSPVYGTKNVKFYYITQTKQRPPSFIAFANSPAGVTPSYRRFLTKNIKTHFGLEGIPIRIFCMKSGGNSESRHGR